MGIFGIIESKKRKPRHKAGARLPTPKISAGPPSPMAEAVGQGQASPKAGAKQALNAKR